MTLRPVNDADWSSGWSLVATADGTTRVIDVTPLAGTLRVTASPAIDAVVFGYDGRARTAGASVQFSLADAGGGVTRCVSIDPAGRPYAREGRTC